MGVRLLEGGYWQESDNRIMKGFIKRGKKSQNSCGRGAPQPPLNQRWKKSKVFLATCGLGLKLSAKTKESDMKIVVLCLQMDFRAT